MSHVVRSDVVTDKKLSRWGAKFAVGSIVVALAATLFPYDFFAPQIRGPLIYDDRVQEYESARDLEGPGVDLSYYLAHVALFIPLGVGLGCLGQRRLGRSGQVMLVVTAVAGLSGIIEVSQAVLPSRSASVVDALANFVGGLLGYIVYRIWGPQIVESAERFLDRVKGGLQTRTLVTAVVAYVVLLCLGSVPLQQATMLRNWDETFPLLIGNEEGGTRPWRGTVHQVQIMGRGLSADEVVHNVYGTNSFSKDSVLISYRGRAGDAFYDQPVNLPGLLRKGEWDGKRENEALVLDGRGWLETEGPAASFVRRLRERSQFTVSAIVATADTGQKGPARIISLSKGPYQRNFTLGQERHYLVFRLRTPLTGENGMNPELVAPKVFTSTDPHHLVITYDGSRLLLFVDGQRHSHSLDLSPGASLFGSLFPLRLGKMTSYRVGYYALGFIPLGCLLGLIFGQGESSTRVRRFMFGAGVVFPSVLLEAVLAIIPGRTLNIETILMSVLFTAGPALLVGFILT